MDQKQTPPVLVGEKVLWAGRYLPKPENGLVKWIGNIPDLSSDWLVGIELETALPRLAGDGFWKGRKLFECPPNQGLLVPVGEIERFSSKTYKPLSAENDSLFKLDDTQLEDFTRSDLLYKEYKKSQSKLRYSYSESKPIEELYDNCTFESRLNLKKPSRRSTFKEGLIKPSCDKINFSQPKFREKLEDVKNLSQKIQSVEKNLRKPNKNLQAESSSLNSDTDSSVNDTLENLQIFHSKIYINEDIKNMNEVAGYFKEIKEGDERFEKQKQTDIRLYNTNEPSHSKPKKLFSFLKWFNKKHKNEPNLKLFKESSAASSPMFPRKETSSCESIDTLFSTQTVRSFAYIPPTQYVPSAPPLDYDKSSYDNVNVTSDNNRVEETESIYDRKKKRKAPEPPRLSRENSLPTTLEHKKPDEDFDGIKTYHRRTVSESFKDKKAGAYCHVQGKKKAPPPPVAPLYPNLQKLNNHYSSLHKKKKPAPPPPDFNSENQSKPDIQKENQQMEEAKKETVKDLKDNGSEEKEMKINQITKSELSKDASLSPLPSRPWYKRSHRDSTGSNNIKKDLLKGFDKKKNKEPDDWMPEVGFPRRSLSTESTHSKFNIFSKLEKTEEKKKDEKRKSQISILTNISELDREAAEILRKEQAEEKKMIAANDAKYYSRKKTNGEITEKSLIIIERGTEKEKPKNDKVSNISKNQKTEKVGQAVAVIDQSVDVKTDNDAKDEPSTIKEEKLKDKENNLNPDVQSSGNPKENLFSPNVLTDLTNSNQSPLREILKPRENSSQARLNFFNVQSKELNYLNEPWVCQKCTLENPGWRVFCEICSSVKPRFPFKNLDENEKVAVKPKLVIKTDIPKKITTEEGQPAMKTTDDQNEKEKTHIEALDELRKRRTNFFTSKLETLSESDKNEPKLTESEIEDTKILVGKIDFLSNGTADERNKNDENKNEISMEKDKELKDVTASASEELEQKTKEENDKSKSPEKKILTQSNLKSYSKNEADKTPSNEQIAEAYVITKTIVLEDIIIKKPERGTKVSSSVQTKSSISPEVKAIRPPPRYKKITFENANQPETDEKMKSYSQKDIEELTYRLTQAEGVADFRADIETMPLNTEMNTVAVNRLLRKLETAINCGDHFVAAGLAKELALMKINCVVSRQVAPSPSTSKIKKNYSDIKKEPCILYKTLKFLRRFLENDQANPKILYEHALALKIPFSIDLYIEDKVSHQGPISLEVSPTMSLLQLKKKVHQELGIPIEVQRWILGKKLATDDNKTLEAEGVKSDYSTLFLYLVAPDDRKTSKAALTKTEAQSELKPQTNTNISSNPKTKGWYYNYEEDHYSYCEDSDDDDSITDKTKEIISEKEKTAEISGNKLKKTETKSAVNEEEKSPVFDLKTGEIENDAGKELKFIPVNSVKQKVEQLNKTFAENAKAVNPPLRSSRSPENWKCNACNVINLPTRLNCLSCNAKKVIAGPNRKIVHRQTVFQIEQMKKHNENSGQSDNIHYKALIELQDADLVPNSEPFNCSICMVDYAPGEGVTLKDCLHTFCRTCLVGAVQFSEDAEVKCPYLDETYSCPSVLQQREIKALVPQKIFELHLAKSVKEAENKIENAFHCKTPDCKGWCIYEDNVNEFRCPVCQSTNCLTCQAIHTGINCREYQERMKDASKTDVDAKKTRDMLNEMVEKGEALPCPKCQVILMKKWGCDWLRCSMCKTEICWVTKGFRWGPEGKGDTSGGCKCGINGIKCHPKCNYCH